MPKAKGTRQKAKKTHRKRGGSGGGGGGSSKIRVVKGRVNVRVSGYSGVQKIAPSHLIPYLPVTKLRQAAKKVLARTSKGPSRKGKRKKRSTAGGKRKRRA